MTAMDSALNFWQSNRSLSSDIEEDNSDGSYGGQG